jgi:uncharacterized protein
LNGVRRLNMPDAAESMETARGMEEAPPKVEEKPEWWASPAVVGLMGFGTTTMIAGLSNLPQPYVNGFAGNWVVFGMAAAFGGIAQLIAGLIALRKGNMFAGSAFMGYGAFWLAFTLMLNVFVTPVASSGSVIYYGVAGFAFIWMLFTFTFLINSPKHGWGIFMVFLFLFIAFLLLTVKFYSIAAGQTTFTGDNAANWAVGGEIIFDGFVAWYVATADLTNWNYGRKVLPV